MVKSSSQLIDFSRTSEKPYGPWPSASEQALSAWMKLDYFEYHCKKHDSPVDFVPDSVEHGTVEVFAPYEPGSCVIAVENINPLLVQNTRSEFACLININTNEPIKILSSSEDSICVISTKSSGSIGDSLQQVKSNLIQSLQAQQPTYRRNVCNFMPSIRFSPPQMLSFEEHGLLLNQLSGRVDLSEFSFFFVTKAYASMGSSPWPLFTAIDTESNWSFAIQAVMEQRNNKNLEARWKISCGTGSEKTDGIDPTRFHIMLVMKTGRLVQLFIDGCNGHPCAQFVIEADSNPTVNYAFLGADRTCSKFFDGEISEFLSYSTALQSRQIDSVGKYMQRKFNLPWSWIDPKGPSILDDWLANHTVENHTSAAPKTSLSGSISVAVLKVSRQRLEQEIRQMVDGLSSPDAFMQSLQALATAAIDQRQKQLILAHDPFDILFSFLESADLAVRADALRVISGLCSDSAEAQQQVMSREGLFTFLQCCEPTWKVKLKSMLEEKNQRLSMVKEKQRLLLEELQSLDAKQITRAFQLRLQMSKVDEDVSIATKEVIAISERIEKGADERNSVGLQRESVKAIAALCDGNEDYQLEFMKLEGVSVLSRMLRTQSIPLKAAICKAVAALVLSHKVAVSFIENGLVNDILQLMLLDDPPLQCEAASVILRVVQHHDLRTGVVHVDAVRAMLLSESEDNHVACTRIIFILAVHDAVMRDTIARCSGVVEALVALSQSSNQQLKQNIVSSLAYLALDDTASRKLWDSNFVDIIMRLLVERDILVVTHAIMALANGCKNEFAVTKTFSESLIQLLCEVGYRRDIGLQHLICGAFHNFAVYKSTHGVILKSNAIRYAVRMLHEGTLHARFIAAGFLRKLALIPETSEAIIASGALPHLVKMSKRERIVLSVPNPIGVHSEGNSLYLHWQAGRCIAALVNSPKNHMDILRQGGVISLIQICRSGVQKLCREGARALAYMAHVRCEDELLLTMAEGGAVAALTELTRNGDEETAIEAEVALSSLLNFDSTWVND